MNYNILLVNLVFDLLFKQITSRSIDLWATDLVAFKFKYFAIYTFHFLQSSNCIKYIIAKSNFIHISL